MNQLFVTLGIESLKPLFATLMLPPVPMLLLILAGTRLMFARRLLGWALVLLGVAGVWLGCTVGLGTKLTQALLAPPRVLIESDFAELRRAPKTTIVVLGGGRRLLAPEYGLSALSTASIERLRYGLWLARETSLPLGFSGGVGHGGPPGPSEAEIAARTAEREFGRKLAWIEGDSRDTRENAIKSMKLLKEGGYQQVVVVTHQYHMRRAVENFQRAAADAGLPLRIIAAPMAAQASGRLQLGDWLPTTGGFLQTHNALHEWLGRLMGA